MEETHRMEIRVKAEVEKKRLDIERELGGGARRHSIGGEAAGLLRKKWRLRG